MKNNSVFYSCLIFVSLSMFHVLQVHASAQSPAKSKQTIEGLKSQISSISKSIKLKENQKNSIQKKIHASDKAIEKLSFTLLEISEKQKLARTKLSDLEKNRIDLTRNIESSNNSMSQLMKAFYLLRNRSPGKLLLNQEDVGKSGRLKVYHDYLIEDYLAKYHELSKQLDSLKTLDASLTKRLVMLDELEKKNKEHAKTLKERYAKRHKELTHLKAEIKADSTKIGSLKGAQKRLEALAKAITKLKLKKSSGTSFAKLKGGLSWPVSGRVVQKFGRTRAGSKLKWRGVLIETNAGASVTAIAKGRVVFSDWLAGYGFVLIIEHGRGYMSLYAHNQHLLSKVGDLVRENQQIAQAGSSGRSGKPALYFEIRHKGKPVNPAKWIIARKSRK